MSGGVDSSVVAAMLKHEGYDVVGITLQLYNHGEVSGRRGSCCAGRDIHDARAVAAKLDIPHYVLDYERRFHDRVIAPFADSYAAGETPIPCVSCNTQVKFADLLETALDLGADILATGHYVASRPVEGGRALFRARDRDRDQSYFLYGTTAAQLAVLRFPLGELTKPDVRALAARHGLVVADKPDSQDICFVPTGRYSDVVARLRPDAARPGRIVHVDGRELGRHAGVLNFTVGQRRGLGLAEAPGAGGEPLYVVGIDAARAEVVVGPRAALATRAVRLRDLNWIGPVEHGGVPPHGLDVAVRLRSTRPPAPAVIERDPAASAGLTVRLLTPEEGVSPGQACVFYESAEAEARVLGGGIIVDTVSAVPPTVSDAGLRLPGAAVA